VKEDGGGHLKLKLSRSIRT